MLVLQYGSVVRFRPVDSTATVAGLMELGMLRGNQSLVLFLAVLLGACPLPLQAAVRNDPSFECERAATIASREIRVPVEVLNALTLAETGRSRNGSFDAWPWTVNMEGKGHWFRDLVSARDYALEHYKRGTRSFDVGCFQINYKWHGGNFSSLEVMFDPVENARYAARFLLELYKESGDWKTAAGYYHSRTPALSESYRKRFSRLLARVSGDYRDDPKGPKIENRSQDGAAGDMSIASAPDLGRPNSFPLLQNSGARAPGSLVPLPDSSSRGRMIEIGGSEQE